MLLEKIRLSCEKFKWTSLWLSINHIICGTYLFAHTELKFYSVFFWNILLLFKVIYIRMFIMLCKFVHITAIVSICTCIWVCISVCTLCVDDRDCHLLLTTIFPTSLLETWSHTESIPWQFAYTVWQTISMDSSISISLVVELYEDTSIHNRYPGTRDKKGVFVFLQQGLQAFH